MSAQNLFSENGYHLFCDRMTCNNLGANCINSASNVGSGSQVFKQISGVSGARDAEFRTLTAGSNITLTQNVDDIQIAATDTNTNIYNSDGTLTGPRAVGLNNEILLIGQAPTPTTPAMFRIQNGQIDLVTTGNTYIGDIHQTNINLQATNISLLGSIMTTSYANGVIKVDNLGNWSTVPSNLVSIYYQGTPGIYSVVVPTNSRYAQISCVAGGGAGNFGDSLGSPKGGGGAGGAVIGYSIPVREGATISVTVGAGGSSRGANGGQTLITAGTISITCSGGIGATTISGGNGGNSEISVPNNDSIINGGSGGAEAVAGSIGSGYFFQYGGSGGGGGRNAVDQQSGPGGNNCMFSGGSSIQSAVGAGGGGGASAFANGGNAGVNFATLPTNGSLGSGGGGCSLGTFGSGGDGFVEIIFTS